MSVKRKYPVKLSRVVHLHTNDCFTKLYKLRNGESVKHVPT